MAAPICGTTCIDEALYRSLATCNYNYACSCQSSDFVASFYSCANAACSAADVEAWTRYAQSVCAAYGVVWSSSAPSPASTPVVTLVATSTSVATAVVVISTAVTSIATSGFATASVFFGLATDSPFSSSTGPNNAVSSPTNAVSAPTNVYSVPNSQSTSSTLSTGVIAGISVGAAAIFVIAVVVFLLWHRRRHPQGATPVAIPETQTRSPDQDRNFDKEAKAAAITTVTSVQYPPELPNEQARPAYKTLVSPIDSPHPPLSPSPPYVEIAGPVPSEIAATTPPAPTSRHSVPPPPPPGFAEADSTTALSANITSPLSELEQPAFIYHELASSSSGAPTFARELSAGGEEEASWAAKSLVPSAAMPAPAPAFVDAGAGDVELARMKAEIEALRAEKERVRQLQNIEERERELSRQIVQMELGAAQRGSGGGGGGGGPS